MTHFTPSLPGSPVVAIAIGAKSGRQVWASGLDAALGWKLFMDAVRHMRTGGGEARGEARERIIGDLERINQ